MDFLSWLRPRPQSEAPTPDWNAPGAVDVSCPECSASEYMVVRPMERARIVGSELVTRVSGQCVVCLVCDTPYVIAPHRAGGILKRRRVAAGVQVPRVPSPDKNGAIDALSRDLKDAGLMGEP